MKCPACGSENSPDRLWCDLCKEPFRRRGETPERAAGPAGASGRAGGEKASRLTPDLMRKLLEARRAPGAVAPGAEPGRLPPEFADLDPGERIPETPRAAKWLAWGFLGVCVFWMLLGSLWALLKYAR